MLDFFAAANAADPRPPPGTGDRLPATSAVRSTPAGEARCRMSTRGRRRSPPGADASLALAEVWRAAGRAARRLEVHALGECVPVGGGADGGGR